MGPLSKEHGAQEVKQGCPKQCDLDEAGKVVDWVHVTR